MNTMVMSVLGVATSLINVFLMMNSDVLNITDDISRSSISNVEYMFALLFNCIVEVSLPAKLT